MKCAADRRRHAAGKLGVAGFESNRAAYPARPYGLQRDDDASAKRHVSAVKRIGLDGIDLPRRTPPQQHERRDAKKQPAERRHANRVERVQRDLRRQSRTRRDRKEPDVQHLNRGAHGHHAQPGNRSDHNRNRDQCGFAGPDDRPQPGRCFEKECGGGHSPILQIMNGGQFCLLGVHAPTRQSNLTTEA